MCDIDKDVCVRPKTHFCRTLCIILFVAIVGFAMTFTGMNFGSLFTPKNETKKNVTEDEEILPYMAGVGIADMTGPVVGIAFMGHADMKQMGSGIHTRQFARAFIIDNNTTRIVIVSAEIHVVGIALRREVTRNLDKMFGADVYNLTNVFIAATHTYSTPGGFLGDYLLDISVLGFSNEVFYAYCNGITKAIVRAHTKIEPARLYYAQTKIWNAHINRSPQAYHKNPKVERNRFAMDTDNILSQIRIMKKDSVLSGVMNFFAINANNLPFTNTLVSSDNLGYAALALEKALNPGLSFHGTGAVVGAFFVGNAGDVSPNIRGARCADTKKPCDRRWKMCDGDAWCEPIGPTDEPRDSAKIIGSGIYEGAMRVLVSPDAIEFSPGEEHGILNVAYKYIQPATERAYKFDPISKSFNQSHRVNGCVPCFGVGYMIGGIDGRPQLTLKDNYFVGNTLLDAIKDGTLMNLRTDDDRRCHDPKFIWVATGRADFPVPWHQVSSIMVINFGGEVFVASAPGEVSTMAGRRIRQLIKDETGKSLERIVIMSIANEYIHHLTTEEEYRVQAMEGGATIYGPNTLDLYLTKYQELAKVAKEEDGKVTDTGPEPAYFKDQAVSMVKPAEYDEPYTYQAKEWYGIYYDWVARKRGWGYVVSEPPLSSPTEKTISCRIMAGNPRNDLMQEMTHFTIDKYSYDTDGYHSIISDADWDTRMIWKSYSDMSRSVDLYWDIPASARYSYYRFTYNGAARDESTGQLVYFTASTRSFYVSYKYTHRI